MKKSALNFESEDSSFKESTPATDDLPVLRLIPYPSTAAVSIVENAALQSRSRKRRRKLIRFFKLELLALIGLVTLLLVATSRAVADAGLTLSFRIAALIGAVAVAIIPVIFYGSTRQRYRYRAGRYRD